MRQAHIFYKGRLAGILTENDAGYEFRYMPEYLSSGTAKAVCLTLPLQEEVYTSPVLFPFSDGLIPEGWLIGCIETVFILDESCCAGIASVKHNLVDRKAKSIFYFLITPVAHTDFFKFSRQ